MDELLQEIELLLYYKQVEEDYQDYYKEECLLQQSKEFQQKQLLIQINNEN